MSTQTEPPPQSMNSAQDSGAPEATTPSPSTRAAIEALLMTADRPIKAQAIIDPINLLESSDDPITPQSLDIAIDALNVDYSASGRSFRIERVAAGYRIMTLSDYAPVVAAMHRSRAGTRLTRTQLETLSIIAYRQPVTRAELENIRGVACGDIVRALMDRQLVKITGRAEVLGRPMLYGTTPKFLDTFGLANLKDLPKPEEVLNTQEQ
ncbi:MAG: SMC-Scp complex subunit ScpB [Phycisphaerales bacterium]|nr:SMC-Scp complex subunit ScpB [Phycisphaerales bacterium]